MTINAVQAYSASLEVLAFAAGDNMSAKAQSKPFALAYRDALATSERALLNALNESGDNASTLADQMTAAIDAGSGSVTSDENARQRRWLAGKVADHREACAAYVVAKPDKGVFAFAKKRAATLAADAENAENAAPFMASAFAIVADAMGQTDDIVAACYENGAPSIIAAVDVAVSTLRDDAALLAAVAARVAASPAFAAKVESMFSPYPAQLASVAA